MIKGRKKFDENEAYFGRSQQKYYNIKSRHPRVRYEKELFVVLLPPVCTLKDKELKSINIDKFVKGPSR